MAERIWPADAVGGAPKYSGRRLRQLYSPYLGGATAADPLGARSGVRPGTSNRTVEATSTKWFCKIHAGVLDVQPAVESGPYTYAIDEVVSGDMVPADASNPRIDLVYVQLFDAAEGNGSASTPPSVTVRYSAGVARAVPTAPATPVRSVALAQINVPRAGAGSPSVTWVAPYAVGPGGTLTVATAAELTSSLAESLTRGTRALALDDEVTYEVRTVDGAAKWVPVSTMTVRVPAGVALPQKNVDKNAPPAGTALIRRVQYVVTGTDKNGASAGRINFAEEFPHAVLHIGMTSIAGSGVNPVIDSGDIDRFGFRPVWPSSPNGNVAFTYEAIGW